MKRRKNILKMVCAAYILAAVCMIAGFLIKESDNKNVIKESENRQVTQNMTEQAAVKTTTQPATQKPTQIMTQAAVQKETQPATQDVVKKETQTAKQETVQPTVEDSPLLGGTYDVVCRAVSNKGSVNMRKAPDNAGAVSGWIPQGGECEVLIENVQGWMLVRYDGYTGFVYRSYLEKK
ncbi:MAG: SH3 domain-containing protein [Bacteroides sp.]